MTDDLADVIAKLDANHIPHTVTGTHVPVIVIPVPFRPERLKQDRWSGPTKGTFVVADNEDLELLFYPDTTWTDGGYDEDAMASAAKVDTRQIISAVYDFGRPLNEIMEFDHVVEVKPNGLIVDRSGIYAPNLLDDELDSDDWSLMNGYSGQDRYPGPIMHDSEFIGGGMEGDIRSSPGIYVAIVSYYSPDEEDGDDIDEDAETSMEGWAVAFRES